LVERGGRVLIDVDFLKSRSKEEIKEIKRMNKYKVGARYQYPHSLLYPVFGFVVEGR
jgi:hypothetical protein